jgi:hypothetical protein
MVLRVALQIAVTVVITVIAVYLMGSMHMKGFMAGMRREAQGWIDAIAKVQPPNWQSLPVDGHGGLDREKVEGANKVYVAAFKVALDVIKEEIAVNRMAALLKDLEDGTLPGAAKKEA